MHSNKMILSKIILSFMLLILFDLVSANENRQSFPTRYDSGRNFNRYARAQPTDACFFDQCYPAPKNLLLGRENAIFATSTCGTEGVTQYCPLNFPHSKTKCPTCHTKEYTKGTDFHHGIEHVIKSGRNTSRTWWQSENGVEMVSIQLNLEQKYSFKKLTLIFASLRPAAMLIEHSKDFGLSWEVYRYFAKNCNQYFPYSQRELTTSTDIICDENHSDISSHLGGEVQFSLFDSNANRAVRSIQAQNDLSIITNIRVNFTKIHNFHEEMRDRREAFYAVSHMIVSGSCFCNGHASKCSLHNNVPDSVGTCICSHNTEGINCEKCLPLYNDKPWAVGTECKKCNCNGHSDSCHFDEVFYDHSNRKSGGVCDDCQHNTRGKNCEECMPFYYRNPKVTIQSPDACIPCECDPRGTDSSGSCEPKRDRSGVMHPQCQCKENVMGERCDQCKTGYFSLSEGNPSGCDDCHPDGSLSSYNGECVCKPSVTGDKCNQCKEGYYGLSINSNGCRKCDCDLGGSKDVCAAMDGECRCRPNLKGDCTTVSDHYYVPSMNQYYHAADKSIVECNSKNGYGCSTILGKDKSSRITKKHRIINEGTVLTFTINNLEQSMNYKILINYQMNNVDGWHSAEATIIRPIDEKNDDSCRGDRFVEQNIPFDLNLQYQISTIYHNICLRPNNEYKLKLVFNSHSSSFKNPKADAVIDYIALIPNVETSSLLQQNSTLKELHQIYIGNGCNETYQLMPESVPSYECSKASRSISKFISDGAVFCGCNMDGTVDKNGNCDNFDGSCECKLNVAGRQCDRCKLGFCNFPNCEPCNCNFHSQKYDYDHQSCIDCEDNTTGPYCDSCIEGYYGDPLKGSCLPCRCPDSINSNHYFGTECGLNEKTYEIQCSCQKGYAGPQCNICADNYYGNPQQIGGYCKPCNCNGGGNCDNTGKCLKCPVENKGEHCEFCTDGYYRNAHSQCVTCECNPLGSDGTTCNSFNGQCSCKRNVGGSHCDECKDGFWNLAKGNGCEQCVCDGDGSKNLICNKIDGQCECKDGYEGKDCSVLSIQPLIQSLIDAKNEAMVSFKKSEHNYLLFMAYLNHSKDVMHERHDTTEDMIKFFDQEMNSQILRKRQGQKMYARPYSDYESNPSQTSLDSNAKQNKNINY